MNNPKSKEEILDEAVRDIHKVPMTKSKTREALIEYLQAYKDTLNETKAGGAFLYDVEKWMDQSVSMGFFDPQEEDDRMALSVLAQACANYKNSTKDV